MEKKAPLIKDKRTLAVVIQEKNEEKILKKAIRSAQLLTGQVVVMDMESSDSSTAEARKAGAKVVPIPAAPYVEPVRNLAFSKTDADWVLILDADERLTPDLAQEIAETVSCPTSYTHFSLARKNLFAGRKWLRHGGWWPDRQIRLIKRSAFAEWPKAIHSTVRVEGKLGYLKEPFLHFFHGDLTEMVKKTIKFEAQEADLLHQAGRVVSTPTFFRKFLGELFRRLVKKRGYKDGAYGLIESLYQAYSKTITWLLVYEKKIHL